MGIILPQEVEITVTSGTVKYYEDKGYKIPRYYNDRNKKYAFKIGTKIIVNVIDLKRHSNQEVLVECDYCKEKLKMQYGHFNRYVRNDGTYYCTHCEHKNSLHEEKIPKLLLKEKLLIDELTQYIEKNGYPTNMRKDFRRSNNLSSAKRYKNAFGGCLVDWIELCEYKLSDNEKFNMLLHCEQISYTKEDVIRIVLNMSKKLNRPLMYDDFRKPTKDNVGITYINKYFGTFNKMKKELGLEIIQESMIDRTPSKEDLDNAITKIVNYVKSLGKDFITEREIKDFCIKNDAIHYACMNKWCKNFYGISFSDRLKQLGINMSNPGNGIVYDFDDGERAVSQFEYMFSTYLRNIGLKYNIDYFRDVKYSSIDDDYNGMMNCDYVIKYKDNEIYIEIAGIIEYYKQWYYSNKPITSSKSKEKYRRKLYEKEQMFKSNGLIYFILFPCDLTKDICYSILNNPTTDLRHNIEKRYKNNIDWRIIQKTGELKYLNELGRDGQPIVDYGDDMAI